MIRAEVFLSNAKPKEIQKLFSLSKRTFNYGNLRVPLYFGATTSELRMASLEGAERFLHKHADGDFTVVCSNSDETTINPPGYNPATIRDVLQVPGVGSNVFDASQDHSFNDPTGEYHPKTAASLSVAILMLKIGPMFHIYPLIYLAF